MGWLIALIVVWVVDLLGCLLALDNRVPYKGSYWLPMGGWLALWENRRKEN